MMKIKMKYNYVQEILKEAHNNTHHQDNTPPKNSPIACDGAQLANAQCHMVSLSIWWESCNMRLKCTFATKQGRVTISCQSYHPTHHHGHTNVWHVFLIERDYFDYVESSYNIWYVYNKWSIPAKTKVVRGTHIIQTTGFGAYTWTCLWWDGGMCHVPTSEIYLKNVLVVAI